MATDRTGYVDIADATGIYFTDAQVDDFVMYTETSNQGILIGTLQSNVSSISIRSNVTTINGTLNINGVTGMLLPKGTTAQRPAAPVQGQVRYNSDINTFEGYGAGNAWGSLGGVKDTNQDTYISAESFPTSNDDALRFFNSNIESMRIVRGGFIGISNTAPSERLELSYGNAKFNSNVYILSRLGVANSNPTEQVDITGNMKTSSNVYILQNLSVGKSNPTMTVDILGNTAIDGSVNTTKYIVSRGLQVLNRSALTYSNTLPSGIVMGFSNDTQGVNITMQNNTSTNYFRFLASNNEVVRITGTGYIGIGTPSPTESLDTTLNIKAQSNIYAIQRIGVGTSNPTESLDTTLNIKAQSNIYAIRRLGVGTSNPSESIDTTLNIKAQSNIYAIQNIGVGTSNPTESLSVMNGKIYSSLQLLGNSNDSSNIPSFSFKEDSNTGFYHSSNQSIGVVTGGVEQMRFGSSNTKILTPLIQVSGIVAGSNNLTYSVVDYGSISMPIANLITGSIPLVSSNPFNSLTEGSLSFNGTAGNYITLANSQYLFNWWTSGGFTLEAWVNYSSFTNASFVNGANSSPSLIGNMLPTSGINYWSFGPTTTGVLAFYYFSGGGNTISTTATLSTNTWTHIAVTCDATNIRLFINGTLSQTTALSGTPSISLTGLVIGQYYNLPISALVSNMRLVKGTALYTASFTPSTTPLPLASSGTNLLLLRSLANPGAIVLPKLAGNSQVQAYPPALLTGYTTNIQNASYGTGNYIVSESGNAGSSYQGWNAFASAGSWWGSTPSYGSASPFAYGGAVRTYDMYGGVYAGDWLQLQLPLPILISSFSVSSNAGNGIGGFCMLGSTDGVNWIPICFQTSASIFAATVFQVTPATAYSYYRIVVTNHAYAGQSYTSILRLIFYRSQEAISITQDGLVGIGVPRPVQPLEVAGNAMFYGNISANNMGMFRNKIINGDMRINQRGGASGVAGTAGTATTGGYVGVDRWTSSISITTGAIQQLQVVLTSSDTPYTLGFKHSLRFTASTACSSYSYIIPIQTIESYNISDLNWMGNGQGYSVSLSFWFRATSTGQYTFALRNVVSSYQAYLGTFNITNSGAWQYISAVIPPPTGTGAAWNLNNNGVGINLYIGSVGNVNIVTANSWTIPGTDGTVVSGNVNWPSTAGNFIEFTGVQLEKGTIATPFEFRPYPIELQLCQRYYENSFTPGTSVGAGVTGGLCIPSGYILNGSTVDTSRVYTYYKFNVVKRAIPIINIWSCISSSIAVNTSVNASGNATAYSIGSRDASLVSLQFIVNTGTPFIFNFHYEASSEI